jgi:hypothetical protein
LLDFKYELNICTLADRADKKRLKLVLHNDLSALSTGPDRKLSGQSIIKDLIFSNATPHSMRSFCNVIPGQFKRSKAWEINPSHADLVGSLHDKLGS